MRKNKKAKGIAICLFVAFLMAIGLTGQASAAATVTDTVSVSGTTATWNITISSGTNITDVYLFYSSNLSSITTEVANATSQTGTSFTNATWNKTGLTNGTTYYYKICYQDNGTWDNSTISSFAVGSSGLALLSLTDDQASEIAVILTYGLIFGLWFIIVLFLLALSKSKKFRKKKPMVDMSNGKWIGIALVLALVLTFLTWYLCNVYLSTDWLQGIQDWLAGLF